MTITLLLYNFKLNNLIFSTSLYSSPFNIYMDIYCKLSKCIGDSMFVWTLSCCDYSTVITNIGRDIVADMFVHNIWNRVFNCSLLNENI